MRDSTSDQQDPSRRTFVKTTAAALASLPASALGLPLSLDCKTFNHMRQNSTPLPATSLIGPYGSWAANLPDRLPSLSFRKAEWNKPKRWKEKARSQIIHLLGAPDIGQNPEVTTHKKYTYDGLDIEELSWQLPYGNPTEAILLKPAGATDPLPGILALHDHGGNKYFAKRKITRTGDEQHPLMVKHQQQYYSGKAWANEIAKKGYVVLVPDNFTFGSRRVKYSEVSGFGWGPLKTEGRSEVNPEKAEEISAYNDWAAAHEHIMAKSLFCGGTTWPGVFLREDQRALDVLCSRPEVDADKVGCGGLSGGGLRTAYLAGLDPRIQCAVCVGFMTTWNDFLLYKSYTHTWMTYVPLAPNYLNFPEILGIRVPLPTLVLNNKADQLFTPAEMKEADRILQEVFGKAGAGEQYQGNFYEGEHKFDHEMQLDAFAWFDRWLSIS